MTKSHTSLETMERWRLVVRVLGLVCVVTGLLIGFPFVLGLLEGYDTGASHELGSDTARALALAPSSMNTPEIVVAAAGVFLLLIAHYLIR